MAGTWAILACVLTAGAAGCHRAGLVTAGLLCGAAALAAAGIAGVRGAGRALPALALLTAFIAGLRAIGDVAWPCPVTCQGGAAFQHLLGLPSWAWAVSGMLAVAVAGWSRPPVAVALAWAMAGGSLFYLWAAWRLDLRCGYCFAVHTGILASALLAIRSAPPRWWGKGALLASGFLALLLLMPAIAPEPTPPASIAPPIRRMSDTIAGIDAIRRLGRADAPLVIEIAIDLHCSRCAATHGPLLDALRPQIAAGRLLVIQRFKTGASDPAGGDLARHVLAAGNATDFALLLSLLLGTPEERGWAEVRSRVGEVSDLDRLERRFAADQAIYDLLILADAERLAVLRCRQTPFALLRRADGTEVGRWQGEAMDVAAIGLAVAP